MVYTVEKTDSSELIKDSHGRVLAKSLSPKFTKLIMQLLNENTPKVKDVKEREPSGVDMQDEDSDALLRKATENDQLPII